MLILFREGFHSGDFGTYCRCALFGMYLDIIHLLRALQSVNVTCLGLLGLGFF